MTDFYFIRHGQTQANAMGLKQGTIISDITHLTELGKQQAQQRHDQFDISFADRVIVSPLERTRQTAAIINQTAGLPVETDDRLLEISYGSWDGLKNADLERDHPEVFDHVLHDVLPTYTSVATDGETFDHVVGRVTKFMTDYGERYPDGKLIAVTHGFTVKAAVLSAMRPEHPMALPEPANTSVTKISLVDERFYVWWYNRL